MKTDENKEFSEIQLDSALDLEGNMAHNHFWLLTINKARGCNLHETNMKVL